jgi:hypothetical protein
MQNILSTYKDAKSTFSGKDTIIQLIQLLQLFFAHYKCCSSKEGTFQCPQIICSIIKPMMNLMTDYSNPNSLITFNKYCPY